MKSFAILSALPLLVLGSPLLNIGTIHHEAAPILSSVEATEIPDSYMIVFKDHISHSAASVHHSWVQNIHSTSENSKNELRKRSQSPFLGNAFDGMKHTYSIAGGLLGYSGHFDEAVIEQIRRHPDVSCYVPLELLGAI